MAGRLFLALVAAVAFSAVAAAQPNFTASRGEVEPAAPRAGDVVRHVFAITNTGGAVAPVHISTSLPRGGFLIGTEGDCGRASLGSGNQFAWHEGAFHNGQTLHCTVIMLTGPGAAGTFANVVTEIRVIPSGYYRVEARAEVGNPIDPNAVRVGPVMMTRAGMIVTAILALLLLGLLAISVKARLQGEASTRQPTGMLMGSWLAVVIAGGFLVYFASLAYEDWRAYSDYRETRCTVIGSEMDSFESRTRSGDQEPSYKPVFAMRYLVGDVETFSTGYTTASALNFNSRGGAGSVFERFATGTTHVCWYDPDDPKTVVLVRGPGGAYVFALLPIPVLLIGLSGLTAGRRGKRDGAAVTRA